MLSVRRLFYVILMVVGICGMFIIYSMHESDTEIVSIDPPVEQEPDLISGEVVDKSKEMQFYIVGNEKKELYGDIYRNVCSLMKDLKLNWKKKQYITREDLDNHRAVFIFCDDTLHSYVELRSLENYMKTGGRVILAAGIAEGYEDSYLMPVLGIVEKTIKENYSELRFLNGFFPVQEEVMHYDGYHASTWLSIRKDAQVYVEDAQKRVPIVYTYAYGEGKNLIINSTLLSDQRMMGFLTAAIGELMEEFVYPVPGIMCVELLNFPVITSMNDAQCMRHYGRTTEAFVHDVVWPVLSGIAVRNELSYTFMEDRKQRTTFPKVAGGVEVDNGNLLTVSSLAAGYGVVVQTIDVNELIVMGEKKPGWDTNKYKLQEWENRIVKPAGYLQKLTWAEAQKRFRRYRSLQYTWEKRGDCLVIAADQLVSGQPFYVRISGQIREAEGADYVKLKNNYYFVRMNSGRAVLWLKEG